MSVAYHYSVHIVAETSKEIPLAWITTVHLLEPIKYGGRWETVIEEAKGADECLKAVNGKQNI